MKTRTRLGPGISLGEIVNAYPVLARQLERLDLDYCCGGDRTLGEACRANELDPRAVVIELAAFIGDDDVPAPWSSMSVIELVEHLMSTHHRYLWDELPRLQALMDKVLGVHGDTHPELVEVARCYSSIRADLEPHLAKEERILFPAIERIADDSEDATFGFGSIGDPMSMMMRDHDELGELLRELRSLTGAYTPPADGCGSYSALFAGFEQMEADTHLHIHKENNVLFPKVIQLEARRRS